MMVHRCDNCKRVISQKREGLELNRGFIVRLELCEACSTPIIDTIIKQQLLSPRLTTKLQAEDPLLKSQKR